MWVRERVHDEKVNQMRKMKMLGLELRDYSVKEALRLTGQYLNNSRLDTVSFLSTDILLSAGENSNLKLWLEAMDLTIPISVEILHAAGITNRSRIKEVENSIFYREFLKRLSNEQKTLYILTETEDTLKAALAFMQANAKGIKIVGSYVFENLAGDVNEIINDINSVTPDVVISRLLSPKQEQFVYENKNKINAKIWLALENSFVMKENAKGLKFNRLSKLIENTVFRRMVSKYENNRNQKDS